MTSSIDKVKSIFMEAIARPSREERAAYLVEACGADAELRANVEELLKVHEAAKDHERSSSASIDPEAAPPIGGAPDLRMGRERISTNADALGDLPTGDINGRYRIIEVLGEGGMGVVCLAQQLEPVRRRVALKVIKLGMDSRRVLSRFEAERQALALLDHPNIAKVFDGGITADGRPYFAMEYVRGVALTDYCDSNRLTIDERLRLFLQVCKAIQHAHQKGIIHRDLKPSNILVALYDDKAVVKVIDFGLAKALHQPLTDFSQFTPHGTAVGTAMYMSPEQAIFNNLDIDTRADVYSLGVILYELLTGTTPLERQRYKQAAWEEVLRIIREEEPMRPSTKLSSTGELPNIAAQRRTEPIKLNRKIRGELDWIVMKALEKERNRRYETASSLAQDIQNYLNEDPVTASPPSAWYHFRKYARRYKAHVGAAAFLLLGLTVATIGTAWGMVTAKRAEVRAIRSAEESQAMEQLLLEDIIGLVDPRERVSTFGGLQFSDISLRTVLEHAARNTAKRLAQVPNKEAPTQLVLGRAFRGLGMYPQAEQHLTRAVKLFREKYFDEPDRIRQAEEELGNLWRLSEPPKSVEHFRRMLTDTATLLGNDDPVVLRIQTQLGSAMQANHQFEPAMELLQETLSKQENRPGPHHEDTLSTREIIASLHTDLGNFETAQTQMQEVLDIQRATLKPNDPAIAITLNNLGHLSHMRAIMAARNGDKPLGREYLDKAAHDYEEALQIMERALDKDHPSYLVTQVNLGLIQLYRENVDIAAQIYDDVIPKLEVLLPHHKFLLAAKNNSAAVWEAKGDMQRVEEILTEVHEAALAGYGPEHPLVQETLGNLQAVRERRQQLEKTAVKPEGESAGALQPSSEVP